MASFLSAATGLSTTNYSAMLVHFSDFVATNSGPSSISFHGGGSKYNDAGYAARTNLTDGFSWSITDGGHE